MENIGQNIRFLRKNKRLTQEEFAKKIGINRAKIGSYEEGRAIPKLSSLNDLAKYFGLSIDALVNQELWKKNVLEGQEKNDARGENLRVVSTVVDTSNKELVTLVPVQASAGYTNGYGDPEYIEQLPVFNLPFPELSKESTYRVFQIKGESMSPVKSGSYIICEYQLDWNGIKDGNQYIILTKDDGIVFKRLFSDMNGKITLKSDNPDYSSYSIHVNEVLEIWKALGYISFDFPEADHSTINKLHQMVSELKNDINNLKGN